VARPETEIPSKHQKKFWLHKRTIVVLAFLTLFWYVICLPGTCISVEINFQEPNVRRYLHGWPMVHLETYQGDARERNDFADDRKRDAYRREALKRSDEPRFFNARLGRGDQRSSRRYLAEAFSFPDPLTLYQVRWVGVVTNLMVFVLLIVCAGLFLERRVRRYGRLFRFELRTLLVLMTLSIFLFSWLLSTYRTERARYQSEKRLNDLTEPHNYAGVVQKSQTVLPLLISQLLNHGKPWIKISQYKTGFFRIKEGHIDFSPYQPDEIIRSDQFPQIITDLQTLDLPVHSTVQWAYRDELEALFLKLEQAGIEIESLDLDVPGPQEEVEEVPFFVDNKFPYLTQVTLRLSTGFDPRAQIERFLEAPRLKRFYIRQVNLNGARFISEQRERFPRNSYFEFEDDVPAELIQSITSSFHLLQRRR